ncbi:MAG: PilZ domain-containing protein [Sphingomicrobium sp.]
MQVNRTASAIVSFDEGRRQPRTHLFVAATIYSDGDAARVRIRNMSPSGVLIEGADLPEPGTAVTLKRGSLEASGEVAWKADQKAGIAFSSAVQVASWMLRHPSSRQARIDAIVTDFKTGRQAVDQEQKAEASPGIGSLETELRGLRAELALLGNKLVNDPILVATHPEIQMLDISVQRVDRMISQIRDA